MQLRWMFTDLSMGHYQPISWLTLGLDYALWGINPFGYHLTSVAPKPCIASWKRQANTFAAPLSSSNIDLWRLIRRDQSLRKRFGWALR
jgi:hypothetical protein